MSDIKKIVAEYIGDEYVSVIACGIERYENEYVKRILSPEEIKALATKAHEFFEEYRESVFGTINMRYPIGARREIIARFLAGEDISHLLAPTGNFTEIEFNNYLSRIIEKSEYFKDIRLEERLSRDKPFRADITAKSGDGKSWLIECKNTPSFTSQRLSQAISQIEAYRSATNFDSYVLAFPGLLSEEQREILKNQNIVAWDAEQIAQKFNKEISETAHPVFQGLFASFLARKHKTLEDDLIDRLKSCEKGKKYWPDYQKLVGQILEHLFCPPLEAPISESSDHFKINRRDWVLPNYSDQGFWYSVREKYHADYIIVDAKNYKAPISKLQVLQIANYLKFHGAGMFALIVTRAGADNSAQLTIREQWMANQKLIVVLNDNDVEAMLLAKSAGGDPSRVIGQAIQQFRLSM